MVLTTAMLNKVPMKIGLIIFASRQFIKQRDTLRCVPFLCSIDEDLTTEMFNTIHGPNDLT